MDADVVDVGNLSVAQNVIMWHTEDWTTKKRREKNAESLQTVHGTF